MASLLAEKTGSNERKQRDERDDDGQHSKGLEQSWLRRPRRRLAAGAATKRDVVIRDGTDDGVGNPDWYPQPAEEHRRQQVEDVRNVFCVPRVQSRLSALTAVYLRLLKGHAATLRHHCAGRKQNLWGLA